jgi:hypothetical protein
LIHVVIRKSYYLATYRVKRESAALREAREYDPGGGDALVNLSLDEGIDTGSGRLKARHILGSIVTQPEYITPSRHAEAAVDSYRAR